LEAPFSLSILIIFFAPFATQNDEQTSSPTRSAHLNHLSNDPPPPTPSFGWLLRLDAKWRPSKSGAPPISQYSDEHHFGAPNKGTRSSARKLRRRAPLLGSWGAAAPRFGSVADVTMEREGKAARGIVRWQRIMSCVVLCVVCVKERDQNWCFCEFSIYFWE
jgi:hypothetical protein